MSILPAQPSTRTASAVLLFSASLWGMSWWPLKGFIAAGLSGPLVSMLAYGLVGLASVWWLWRDRAEWMGQWPLVLGLALVGGWANTSFVNALMLGDVVRVMFLFYLSPVWSVLGGWLFLKERIPLSRWAATVAAIIGLWMVLGAPGPGDRAVWSSFSVADALALLAGLAFSANNIIARAADRVPLRTKAVSVFVGCGILSAMAAAIFDRGWPDISGGVWLGLLAYGFIGLVLATVTWQYGVSHLEASRSGVILLAELVVAVLTAVWWGDESLNALAWAGGALIAAAALVEALSEGDAPSSSSPTQPTPPTEPHRRPA